MSEVHCCLCTRLLLRGGQRGGGRGRCAGRSAGCTALRDMLPTAAQLLRLHHRANPCGRRASAEGCTATGAGVRCGSSPGVKPSSGPGVVRWAQHSRCTISCNTAWAAQIASPERQGSCSWGQVTVAEGELTGGGWGGAGPGGCRVGPAPRTLLAACRGCPKAAAARWAAARCCPASARSAAAAARGSGRGAAADWRAWRCSMRVPSASASAMAQSTRESAPSTMPLRTGPPLQPCGGRRLPRTMRFWVTAALPGPGRPQRFGLANLPLLASRPGPQH